MHRQRLTRWIQVHTRRMILQLNLRLLGTLPRRSGLTGLVEGHSSQAEAAQGSGRASDATEPHTNIQTKKIARCWSFRDQKTICDDHGPRRIDLALMKPIIALLAISCTLASGKHVRSLLPFQDGYYIRKRQAPRRALRVWRPADVFQRSQTPTSSSAVCPPRAITVLPVLKNASLARTRSRSATAATANRTASTRRRACTRANV
jgi:hypothetical protein